MSTEILWAVSHINVAQKKMKIYLKEIQTKTNKKIANQSSFFPTSFGFPFPLHLQQHTSN